MKTRVNHILNQGFLPLNRKVKKDMVLLGSLAIGIRTLLMTLQVQLQEELLHGLAREILHGWILVVPDQLDQEQQLEDSRNMRCIMALQKSFAPATSPL